MLNRIVLAHISLVAAHTTASSGGLTAGVRLQKDRECVGGVPPSGEGGEET